ncbi:MAG TPA: fused MFS/spermidine synthase [Rhizomicrobium sp.]|nr:fused MFS/spermidine synthase [Rhizomicrobium sp.]
MTVEAAPPSIPATWRALDGAAPLVVAAFGMALFSSAFLLFWLEPLFARLLLPRLGGSQGVWNTCLVFFQASLLLGYAYAHLLARFVRPRTQVLGHLVAIAVGLLFLPIALNANWTPPASGSPVLPLLAVLASTLGWPFFALSANAPLLQRWFSFTGHRRANDPYFLYAASNAGSLLALIAYPFLIEPNVTLSHQSRWWAWGYCALACAIAAAGAFAVLGRGETVEKTQDAAAAPLGWRERLTWLAYAALPSSLLLGVTGYVATDVASFPLLWIAPLAIYLLTFILTFAGRPPIPHRWMVRALPMAIVLAAVGFWLGPVSLALTIASHFLAFFIVAMVCHGELARRKPDASRLTEFYLWMSLGGVVGGALTALVSPLIFKSIIEYPLALSLVCLLQPADDADTAPRLRELAILAAAIILALIEPLAPLSTMYSICLTMWIVAMLVAWGLRPKHRNFLLAALGVLLASQAIHTLYIRHGLMIWRDRSFYGAYSVTQDDHAGYRIMFHGTTLHGVEKLKGRPLPLTYYAPQGPLGDVMRAVGPRASAIGAIGLGVGSEACYARADQSWTFYEIDPLVEQLAVHSGLFHAMSDCAPQARVVLGDGRLSLEHAPPHRFDILILDAFSSDAIPIHLVTREAFASYIRALKPHGIIVAHITNRYFNLSPIIARIAPTEGLVAYGRNFKPVAGTDMALISLSRWLVLAKSPADVGAIATDPNWQRLIADPKTKLWTDDFSNVLSALQ